MIVSAKRTARSSWILSFVVVLAISVQGMSSPNGHLTAATKGTRPAPKAVVPFNTYSFGDVFIGEVISQIFVIKNEGDADLVLTNFKADCGCTVARSDRIIPAGKEGTAEVEVQTVSQSGLINRSAVLHTNDPARPAINFTLTANVLKGPMRQGKYVGPIFLSPDTRLGMYAVAGKKAMTQFSITANGSEVKVLRVEAGTKQFVPRVEVVQPGKSYKILVESAPIETEGLYIDKVRVITDNPTLPAFSVDVTLRVYPTQ